MNIEPTQVDDTLKQPNPPQLMVSQSVIETKKGILFINEKILGDKPVEVIAGIGPESAKKFRQDNIYYAYQIVGFYLMHGKNDKDLENLLMNYISIKKNLVAAKNSIVDWVASQI
jgi:hypothetical protein